MADGKTSPFGNPDGGAPSSGGHDFTKDNTSHSPKTGGRDFTKESRSQTADAKKEVEANPASIPSGGPLPFKAPGPSGNTGDTAPKTPFKGLK